MMNANQLPGCVVPDKLLAQLDQERNAEDKGVGARLLRAAKMYALLKGLGFDGVDIGGHNIKYEQVEYIIDQGEELSADWDKLLSEFDYPQPQGFYFYARDTKTGLNTPDAVDRSDLPAEVDVGLNYRMMRMFHELFFTPDKNFYPLLYRYYARVKDPRRYKLEHVLKVIGNDCRDCGDCALLDLAYLCPMSQLSQNQRNGPAAAVTRAGARSFPTKRNVSG